MILHFFPTFVSFLGTLRKEGPSKRKELEKQTVIEERSLMLSVMDCTCPLKLTC